MDRHYHKDERGLLVRCYHVCRHKWYVWLPIVFVFQVLMFPLEHQIANELWQLPILSEVAKFFGWHFGE